MNHLQELDDFFTSIGHDEARERMVTLLDVTVTGSFNSKVLNRRERTDLVHFIHELESLLDAAHGIYQDHADQLAAE